MSKSIEEITNIKRNWLNSLDDKYIMNDIAAYIVKLEKNGVELTLKNVYKGVADYAKQDVSIRRTNRLLGSLDYSSLKIIQYPIGNVEIRLMNLIVEMRENTGVLVDVIRYYIYSHNKKYHNINKGIPLDQQPATDKQIWYLKKLGCDQVPTNKKMAMELINECLNTEEVEIINQ
jgi:hypothetical protein